MRGFGFSKWLSPDEVKNILERDGYTIRTARMMLKDLGYTMEQLCDEYALDKNTLNYDFAFTQKNKDEVYNALERTIKARKDKSNPRWRGSYAWWFCLKEGGSYYEPNNIHDFLATTIVSKILTESLDRIIDYGKESIDNLP